jgi:hypothetical protein
MVARPQQAVASESVSKAVIIGWTVETARVRGGCRCLRELERPDRRHGRRTRARWRAYDPLPRLPRLDGFVLIARG